MPGWLGRRAGRQPALWAWNGRLDQVLADDLAFAVGAVIVVVCLVLLGMRNR